MSQTLPEAGAVRHHGWRVTFAGMGVNLALGILYTWSVISKGIPAEWEWSEAGKSWPYAVACLVFSIIMVPAGRMQDRLGPRLVATIGGVLVGVGMVLAALCGLYVPDHTLLGFILGFGVLAGAGIGFGYASATPPAVKWFAAARTGLIAGLVVSGFGLASVWAAPATTGLIRTVGVPQTMLVLGLAFLVVVVVLAQLLVPPPAGFRPAGQAAPKPSAGPVKKEEFTPGEMLRTWQFYLLWVLYAFGAGAGLMIIAKLAAIAKVQANVDLGFLLVAALAVGNGGGRIGAGILSDRIGRRWTLLLSFVFQAALICLLSQATEGALLAQPVVLAVLSALIGANYGANLSLFPSVTKDFYGLKNFGVNYGLVFTAWGVGGFMLAMAAGRIYDVYKTFDYSYYGAAGLLVIGALMTFAFKAPHHHEPAAA